MFTSFACADYQRDAHLQLVNGLFNLGNGAISTSAASMESVPI
jgi:hypothetical protein